MPSHRPPTLDALSAQRWHQQLRRASDAPWLHAEVAKRTLERLDYLKLADGPKLLWEPTHAGTEAQESFAKRLGGPQTTFVQADNTIFDDFGEGVHVSNHCDATKKEVIDFGKTDAAAPLSWVSKPLKRWFGSPPPAAPPTTSTQNLPPAVAQLVWSNLLIHGHPQPQALMGQWFAALAVGGCAMFSALGVDTGRELSQAFADAGHGPAAAQLTDMHDWGDMLIEAGFANPVMDMEKLTLTYPSAQALLAEWRGFGRNAHNHRFAGLRTPRWRKQLEQTLDSALRRADGSLAITVELVYGHAFKPERKHAVSEMSAISMQDMRAMLRRN